MLFRRLLKTLFRLRPLLLRGRWYILRVIVKRRSQDKIGRQRKMIYPMSMRRQGMFQRPADCIPDLDRLVLACAIDKIRPAPSNAANTALQSLLAIADIDNLDN